MNIKDGLVWLSSDFLFIKNNCYYSDTWLWHITGNQHRSLNSAMSKQHGAMNQMRMEAYGLVAIVGTTILVPCYFC